MIYKQEYIDYLISVTKPLLGNGNSLAIKLLNNPSEFRYTQTEVFDMIYNMAIGWANKQPASTKGLGTLSYDEFVEREREIRLDKIVN